jgi:hypothetical protein
LPGLLISAQGEREMMLLLGRRQNAGRWRSKRDVVKWAAEMGGIGSQLSNAASISLKELQSDKY